MGVKVGNFCVRKLASNLKIILDLFIHASFEEIILSAVRGSLIFSFNNSLDSHSETLSKEPESFVQAFIVGWNIKKNCDPSVLK